MREILQKYFILIITFLLFTKGFAQSITGIVLDDKSAPIEFANVILTNTDTNKIISGAITNPEGKFQLKVEDCECKLMVSFVGFEKWSKKISVTESLDLGTITLKPSTNKLDEVIVNAEVPLIKRKEDKIVFDVKNSPLKSGFTGVEVLEQSPSVWVDNSGTISIRNESARILVNGRKLNLTGQALVSYLDNIKSDNIISVEVQTNKDASREAESTGGNINILLKKIPKGFNGSIGSFYSFKERGYFTNLNSVNFNYGAEKWNVYGSYSNFFNTGLDKSITSISYTETDNFLQTNRENDFYGKLHRFSAGFVTQLSKKHELGLELFGNFNDRENDNKGNFYLRNNLTDIDRGTVKNINDISLSVLNTTLNYTWLIDKSSDFRFYLDFLQNGSKNENNFESVYELGVFDDAIEKNTSDNKANVVAFQGDYTKKFKNNLKLESGLKYTTTNRENDFISEFLDGGTYTINNDRTTSYNYKEKITAGYVSLGKKFKEKNFVKIGVRLENTDLNRKDLIVSDLVKQNYTNLFPSFFYSREFGKNKSASLSYSRSLRRPSFSLLNNNVVKVNDFRYELGNPDLQPEFIDKYEFNFLYKRQSISLYYNQTNDAINGIFTLDGDIAYYQKFNSGKQVQFGIDYSRSDKITNWWRTRFATNLYNRKFVDEQGNDSFEQFTVRARLFNTFKLNKTTNINLSGFYNSPRRDAYFKAFENYWINLGFRKTFSKNKFSLRVDINDVFNTDKFRSLREFENYETTYRYKRLSRFFRVWLTYNFSNKVKASKKRNKSKNEVRNRL